MESTVKKVVEAKGFGFIAVVGEVKDTFFHMSALDDDLEFNEQLTGRRVLLETIDTGRGPQATIVCAAV